MLTLVGGTLIDGTGRPPLPDSVVRVEGGVISAVGRRSDFGSRLTEGDVIDVSGCHVLPGLINMHVHVGFGYRKGPPMEMLSDGGPAAAFHATRLAAVMLAQGITTAREMGGREVPLRLRDATRSGSMLGPELICCGQPISITGGHAWQVCVEADGADAFRRAARRQLKEGADFVKVIASHDPWPMAGPEQTRAEVAAEEIAAAFAVAHEWGRQAACHVMGSKAIDRVLDAGVDIIDHGHYLTPVQAERMAAAGTHYVPTLSSYDVQTLHPRFSRGADWVAAHSSLLDGHRAAMEAALAEGVRIAVGTDSVGCYAEEVQLLREAGLPAMTSLLACTREAATALGRKDIGVVEVGRRGDLAVFEGDPLADAYALEHARYVVRSGRLHRVSDLIAEELALGGDILAAVRRPETSSATPPPEASGPGEVAADNVASTVPGSQ